MQENTPTIAAAAPLMEQLQEKLAATLESAGLSKETAAATAKTIAQTTALAVGTAVGGVQGGTLALNVDANNRQLHPDERKWAKDNANKYKAYLKEKTGETVSTEEAYQRLLSAGYAVVDTAAQNTGKSDEVAKQFIGEASPKTLFTATAAERNNPLLGGNPDGSYTPEQQARFGVKNPSELAQLRVQAAQTVARTTCETVACAGNKVQKIVEAVTALEQQRTLYQDDPAKAANISAQQNQLLGSLSKQDIVGAKLQAADEALLFEVLMLPSLPSLSASLSRSTVLSKLTTRIEVAGAETLGAQGAKGANGGVPAVSKIDLAPPLNTYPVYTRGAGAAEGPLPPGYTTVSRWVSPEEASLWVQNQGTAIPAAVPRNGTPQVYVSEAGAPRAPGATGTVRIDFAVPNSMLQTGNASNNSMILQPSSSTPIYNVNIHVPNGVTLPKAR